MENINSEIKDSSVFSRTDLNKLFLCEDADFDYTGEIDDTLLFLQDTHLKNRKMWALFVSQYRVHLDTPSSEKNGTGKWFGGWRGEYWGKMMRGAVMVYAYTKDAKLYEILEETVIDILSTQDERGRISTYLPDEEFGLWDLWCRKYVFLGLEYFCDICKSNDLKLRIIDSLCKAADAVTEKIGYGKKSILDAGHPVLGGLNAASILEPMVKLYNITGNKNYLEFGSHIVSCGFSSLENIYLSSLNETKHPYEFGVRKAYEMMSCMEGLLEYYRVTKDRCYLKAVKNFAAEIIKTDVTVIGGCGCDHERLDNSSVTQTDPSITTLKNETCVTVTWMKLCTRLLLLTGDSRYADRVERSALNALQGAVNTKKIGFDFERIERYRQSFKNNVKNGINDAGLPFDSYSPLLPGFRGLGVGGLKKMQEDSYYGCCACIGAAGVGLFADTSVLQNKNGLVFNYYFNGSISVKRNQQNFECGVTTKYPYSGDVRISISDCPNEFELSFRIPSFSRNTIIKVNGRENYYPPSKAYFSIKRNWKKGDIVDICFDMNPHIQSQNGFSSIQYGPIVLGFDERFGYNLDNPFPLATDEKGKIGIELLGINHDNEATFSVPLNGGKKITCCNYSSAGKNWYNGKRIAAWVLTDSDTISNIAEGCEIKDDLV